MYSSKLGHTSLMVDLPFISKMRFNKINVQVGTPASDVTFSSAEELAANEQVRSLYLGKNFELKRKDYLHDEAAR